MKDIEVSGMKIEKIRRVEGIRRDGKDLAVIRLQSVNRKKKLWRQTRD